MTENMIYKIKYKELIVCKFCDYNFKCDGHCHSRGNIKNWKQYRKEQYKND
jgi:hypothetical protein